MSKRMEKLLKSADFHAYGQAWYDECSTCTEGETMYAKLTTPEKLKDLRIERGLTLEQLAEATGLSKSALDKYETDDYKDVSPFAIVTLAKYYGVSTDYLLGLTETKNHPNTALDELHLGDDVIDLLKGGTINTRLLGELAVHPGFQRFLTDVEIYVDRIADMRISDMNTILDAIRRKVIEEHHPGENDLYVRTLEVSQITEEDYFSHVIHKDLDQIIRDIREAHKTDSTTADEPTPAAEVQKQLEDAMHFQGSEPETKTKVFLASLGIDYDALTTEEFVTLMGILNKSSHMKTPISRRGKNSGKKRKR